MTEKSYDVVIIGGGAAGVAAAHFAASIGVKAALVETTELGGEAVWSGRVPLGAIAASAKVAHTVGTAGVFGITAQEPTVDLKVVWARGKQVSQTVFGTNFNAEALRDLGVDIYLGHGSLRSATEVEVTAADGSSLSLATRFVLLCSGTKPNVPNIDGIANEAGELASYALTPAQLLALDAPPAHVAIVGSGPTGVELAQTLNRLGVTVELLMKGATALSKEDSELSAKLLSIIEAEGVNVHSDCKIQKVSKSGEKVAVALQSPTLDEALEVDAVVVATGRTPNLSRLGLDAAGVRWSTSGVTVDNKLRTSVPGIYAAGGVNGRYMLDHASAYEAVVALRNMFFMSSSAADNVIAWCTYTDPELAHAGLTEDEARAVHQNVVVHRREFVSNIRAESDGQTEGIVKIIASGKKVVGAQILGPGASSWIHELVPFVQSNEPVSDIAALVHIEPSYASSVGKIGAEAAFARAQDLKFLMRRRKS